MFGEINNFLLLLNGFNLGVFYSKQTEKLGVKNLHWTFN